MSLRGSRWRSLRDGDVSGSPPGFRRRMSHGGPGDGSPDFTPRGVTPDSDFSAEAVAMLTAKERSSRLMHHSRPRERLRTGMPLMDMFVVIGSGDMSSPTQSPMSPGMVPGSPVSPSSSTQGMIPNLTPKVLFQYPQNSEMNASSLIEFCFPEGTIPEKATKKSRWRTKENSFTPSRLAMMAVSFLTPLSPRVSGSSSTDSTPKQFAVPDPPADISSGQTPPGSTPKRSTPRFPRSSSAIFNSPRAVSDTAETSSPPTQAPVTVPAPVPHQINENSFVFLITGHTYLRYGICIYKDQVVRSVSHIPLCSIFAGVFHFFVF